MKKHVRVNIFCNVIILSEGTSLLGFVWKHKEKWATRLLSPVCKSESTQDKICCLVSLSWMLSDTDVKVREWDEDTITITFAAKTHRAPSGTSICGTVFGQQCSRSLLLGPECFLKSGQSLNAYHSEEEKKVTPCFHS